MVSRNLMVKLGLVLAAGSLIGSAALASGFGAEPSKVDIQQGVLSWSELEAIRTGRVNEVPENCTVQTSLFTGQCIGVVCVEEGIWVLHECSDFGL